MISELKDLVVVRLEQDLIQDIRFVPARYGGVIIPGYFTFRIYRDGEGRLARIDFYNEKGDHVFACDNQHVLAITGNGLQGTFPFPKE